MITDDYFAAPPAKNAAVGRICLLSEYEAFFPAPEVTDTNGIRKIPAAL